MMQIKCFKGAEAVVSKSTLLGRPVVIKERIKKTYRISELDEKLRRERTRAEARLLHKAKIPGIRCPVVLEVNDFSITMSFVEGERPEMNEEECEYAGKMLALLHSADIIHGDFTPANLVVSAEKMLYVIDFGLGFFSNDIEDKAIDVYTMLKALESEEKKKEFVNGYKTMYETGNRILRTEVDAILRRVEEVSKRVRYAQ